MTTANHTTSARSRVLSLTRKIGQMECRTLVSVSKPFTPYVPNKKHRCTGWLAMTNYYATAFRQGSYPSITQDQIYIWARPHPKNADASNDPVAKPTSYQLVSHHR